MDWGPWADKSAWLLAVSVLLLGVVWAQPALPCPAPCRCQRQVLSNLTTLTCARSAIGQVPAFPSTADDDGAAGVGWLDLSGNHIRALEESLANFSSLVELNMSGNALTVLGAADLAWLSRLQKLDLSHNQIQGVESGALTNLSNLVTLRLSFNNISTLELGTFHGLLNLASLDLSANALQVVEPEAFYNLSSLSTLNLSNNSIHTIQPEAFYDLLSIQNLDLSLNRLSNLEWDVLAGLESLRTLNASHNQLQQLGSLQNLSSLAVLDLSYNQLQALPASLLRGLGSLEVLRLHHNALLILPEDLLPGLPHLASLDLHHNQLSSLGRAVSAMPRLAFLDLADNPLQQIQPDFLAAVHGLVQLNLDGTLLEVVDIPHLRQQAMLQWLSLSGMERLQKLPHDAFQGLTGLQHLNLSHNPRLSFVHPHLFSSLSALQDVDLRHCNISVLSLLTFHGLAHLRSAWLAGNPFHCDCQLAWLARDLHHNASMLAGGSDLTCSTPDGAQIRLQDSSLALDYLACPEVTEMNETDLVKFRVGSSARLVCGYEQDPSTVLMWTTSRNRVFTYHPFHTDAVSHLADPNDTLEGGPFHYGHWWHGDGDYHSELSEWPDRLQLLSDGSLYIDYVLRSDSGPYLCMAYNAHFNTSVSVTLHLDHGYLYEMKMISLLVGFSTAFSFLLLTGIFVLISAVARRLINKRRRAAIKNLLENLDTYRSSQITRVRENCSTQLGRIRDTYHNQVDRLRDNYGTQMKRVRQGCSHKVDRIRDNYNLQLERLRGYSSHQIEQIREVYSNQLLKMRDYGSQQLERIRETYKLQQQHVIKLLETMNIDNCRSIIESECTRTESMIFESEHLTHNCNCETSPDHSCSSSNDSEYVTASNSKASSRESMVNLNSEDDVGIAFSAEALGAEADSDPECYDNLQAVLVESYSQQAHMPGNGGRENQHILPVVIEIGEGGEDDLSQGSRESEETTI